MLEAIRLKLSDNPFQDHRVSQDPGTKTSRIDATSKHDLFQPSKITSREGPRNQAVDFTATFGDYSRNDRNDQRMNESTNGTGENGV